MKRGHLAGREFWEALVEVCGRGMATYFELLRKGEHAYINCLISAESRAKALEHLTAALEKEQVDLINVEHIRVADLSEWKLEDDDARVSDIREEVIAEVVIFGYLYTWEQNLPPEAG